MDRSDSCAKDQLREGDGALTLSDPATIRRFVEEVEATLLPRLLEGAEG
jgi:hypothetical protein